ncbi:MAG: hypothetical protein J0M15_14235 [Deltaproteobacteria bacterium]|nr:hypothetical protein [Deltaproteobacteria bacterium]
MNQMVFCLIFLFSFGALTLAHAQQPNQILINVEREDFKPLQAVQWKVLVGSSSLTMQNGSISRTGNGLGVGIERILSDRWSAGASYANMRVIASDSSFLNQDDFGNQTAREYKENIHVLSAYGKYSIVNLSVNKWNLVQVSLLGGVMDTSASTSKTLLNYGAAVSYNYDNLIGFELNTKVNQYAESATSANLIGYF